MRGAAVLFLLDQDAAIRRAAAAVLSDLAASLTPVVAKFERVLLGIKGVMRRRA